MSATQTIPTYVACDQFCGNRIEDPDKDHAADCGAPLAERKRIADLLKAAKIKAAIGTEPQETTLEVNSRPARGRRGPPREEEVEKPRWIDPQVQDGWIAEAQRSIDNGTITIRKVIKHCQGKHTVEGFELDCPHIVAFTNVEITECDQHKYHNKKIMDLCLIHWVRYLAANLPPMGMGPLLDNVT